MPRRKRSPLARWWADHLRFWRLLADPKARRRSEGAKRGAATRKRRAMAVKVEEPQTHHPECQWSFSIVHYRDDGEHASWLCVTECLYGGPPNAPEPPPRPVFRPVFEHEPIASVAVTPVMDLDERCASCGLARRRHTIGMHEHQAPPVGRHRQDAGHAAHPGFENCEDPTHYITDRA